MACLPVRIALVTLALASCSAVAHAGAWKLAPEISVDGGLVRRGGLGGRLGVHAGFALSPSWRMEGVVSHSINSRFDLSTATLRFLGGGVDGESDEDIYVILGVGAGRAHDHAPVSRRGTGFVGELGLGSVVALNDTGSALFRFEMSLITSTALDGNLFPTVSFVYGHRFGR